MKILVTNDDGIFAEGLWALVKELKNIADVIVVAPDREQSGIGTAITLSKPRGVRETRPVRVQEVRPMVAGVETYSVEGTPADSVILALEKLAKDQIALVISGINRGPNTGHDVFVSGTVGAALQGYLHGLPALAISVLPADNRLYLDDAAKVATLLAERIYSRALPADIFLNINLPDRPLAQIGGIKVTRLVNTGHIGTVEPRNNGTEEYYCLMPQKINKGEDRTTDTWAIKQGRISITPLHTYLNTNASPSITDSFCSDIFKALQKK